MDNNDKIELLAEAGEAAYGKSWKTELAKIFGINERTVRYWATGERTVPETMLRGMISHLRDRADLMHRVADNLANELKFSDNYAELKITVLDICPSMPPDINGKIEWFDVDGHIYGVTEKNMVIDKHGKDTELRNATVDELLATKKRLMKSDARGID